MRVFGRFDGKVVVLESAPPENWQPNVLVEMTLTEEPPGSEQTKTLDPPCEPNAALMQILKEASDLGLPADFSEQHDHYLYGTPKR